MPSKPVGDEALRQRALERLTVKFRADRDYDAFVAGLRNLAELTATEEVRERRKISAADRRNVLSPGARCVYCGAAADVIDHVVPIARGGTSERSNLAPACTGCNGLKDAMPAEDFAEVMDERARFLVRALADRPPIACRRTQPRRGPS